MVCFVKCNEFVSTLNLFLCNVCWPLGQSLIFNLLIIFKHAVITLLSGPAANLYRVYECLLIQ